MKRLTNRLIRAVLFVLALFPIVITAFTWLVPNLFIGAGIFALEIVLLSLIALLPAYIGNYREYEVVSYENARNSDPNPDREAVRETVSEGHRFPLRLFSDIAFFLLTSIAVLFLPKDWFIASSIFRKLFFILILLVLQMFAAKDLPAPANIWEDIPGIFIGAVGYLVLSVYLHFTAKDVAQLQILTSVCAVAYLFLGAVALNKQSISLSMSAHSGENMRVPKLIVIRNRRIVFSFALVVTVVSLIEPVRRLFSYLAQQLGRLLSWIFGLNPSASQTAPPMPVSTIMEPVGYAQPAMEETAAEMGLFSKIIVYGFLILVAVGFIWVVFDAIKKLIDKVTKWLEKMAGSVSEGFYDEKEELMSADEMRDQIKNSLLSGVKGLFRRETPWHDLSGREKARRLLSLTLKKRMGKTKNVGSKTAKEAIYISSVPETQKEAFARAYDEARYSGHPVSGEDMDALKKDLKL
ncbi:MAG: hypothetical protein IJD86_13840 [Clostridia bacterium]|nr:hypothetical protein [Clostridia bacterium]